MLPIQKLFSSNQRTFKVSFAGIAHEENLKEVDNSANEVPRRLEVLKEKNKNSQPSIIQYVEKVKDENLLGQLIFLGFHEAYHLGQIGLIRKLSGKEGAIR